MAAEYNFYAPPILRAAAASGSLYYGGFGTAGTAIALELAPSVDGRLDLLAADSIYAADGNRQLPIVISGANPADLPTPLDPAYSSNGGDQYTRRQCGCLFAFEADTPTTKLARRR